MSENQHFENYELLRREDGSVFELGRGAMGVTYKALDTDLHCHVALKVINPGILGNGDSRERFLREARSAAKLRHQHIAAVFRLGRAADDTHFYAMEFCEGPTLAQAVAEQGPFGAADAVGIAWQVSKALTLAEEHQLLHRDLKPSNLILTQRPDEGTVVKVIDFGLAKSFADGQQSLASMSGNGFIGTAQFASPEQLEEKELDIRSDIYSLGVCIWFMLAGRPPFEGSLARVMSQTLTSEPPWGALDGQPAAVVALLRRMLAKDRERRPSGATALREELEACYQKLVSPDTEQETPEAAMAATGALDTDAFNTRFLMAECIGREALGKIFLATDNAKGGAQVVVHVVDRAFTNVPTLRREIEERVEAAKQHPHRNLLAPVAYLNDAQGFCIVIPQTNGFTLLELLKQRGTLAPVEVLRVLEPLGRAASHAARHRVLGLDLSREQIVVDFPGWLSEGERARLTALPLDQSHTWEIKAGVLSLGQLSAESDSSLTTMGTMVPAAGAAAALAPVKALACLVCELLGGRSGGVFTPIARLSEQANGVLRRALADENAFPSASGFVEAFRAAVGKTGSSSVPAMRANASSTPAVALRQAPQGRSSLLAALVLLAIAGLGAGYWFGIHEPRERDREKRQTEADSAEKELEDKQHLAESQAQNAKDQAEKAKAEADKQRLALQTDTERMKAEVEKAKAEAEQAKAELEKAKLAAANSPPSQQASSSTEHSKPSSNNLSQRDSEGFQPGSVLALMNIRKDDSVNTPNRKFTLKISLNARPGAKIDVHDVVIQAFFYDSLEDGRVVPTNANITSHWSTLPVDWNDNDIETLDVEYSAPPPNDAEQKLPETHAYYGYIVRVYYKGDLQDMQAEPAKLRTQYPAPLTLSSEIKKEQIGSGLARTTTTDSPASLSASNPTPTPQGPKRNKLGMIEGNYVRQPNTVSGELGSSTIVVTLIIKDNTYHYVYRSWMKFNSNGRAAGRVDISYVIDIFGPIISNGDGTVSLLWNRVQLGSSMPRNNPTAMSAFASFQKSQGTSERMVYSDGRISDLQGNPYILSK